MALEKGDDGKKSQSVDAIGLSEKVWPCGRSMGSTFPQKLRPSGFFVGKEGANQRGLRSCIRIDDPTRNGRARDSYPWIDVGHDSAPPF